MDREPSRHSPIIEESNESSDALSDDEQIIRPPQHSIKVLPLAAPLGYHTSASGALELIFLSRVHTDWDQ